jgi:mannitol 2-dehydrogenase
MIHGIGLREADIALVEPMNRQDNLYTLTERSGSHDTIKIIGSIKEYSYAPSDPQRVIQLLASDAIKIISLTITEKGYYYDARGDLDIAHPDIKADLHSSIPRTAVGFLFSAAKARKEHNGSPMTLLSCDNLPSNGDLLHHLLVQFAESKERAVADWIRDNTSCPNAMVDRITPAVTQETRDLVRNRFEIDDQCPVMSEAYLQWVLEDHFINGRPQLEMVTLPVRLESRSVAIQVQLTDDVAPYEKLKMRLLNGSHSALAYGAYLMGFRFVDEAMGDPIVRSFVQRYMDEITPTIPDVPGVDIAAYKATLIERFSNAAIRDQVQRLAEDGSKKMRNFVVPPLADLLSSGGSIQYISFALAAWFRYLRGLDEQGQPIEIVDPMSRMLKERAQLHPHDPADLLALEQIFGEHISANTRVASAVKECLDAIDRLGTRQACGLVLEMY